MGGACRQAAMVFSRDPSAQKRVDLGGRSSEERRRCQALRLQYSSTTKILVCPRIICYFLLVYLLVVREQIGAHSALILLLQSSLVMPGGCSKECCRGTMCGHMELDVDITFISILTVCAQRAASCARAMKLQGRLEGDNEGVEVSVRADGNDDQAQEGLMHPLVWAVILSLPV